MSFLSKKLTELVSFLSFESHGQENRGSGAWGETVQHLGFYHTESVTVLLGNLGAWAPLLWDAEFSVCKKATVESED